MDTVRPGNQLQLEGIGVQILVIELKPLRNPMLCSEDEEEDEDER